MSRVASWVTKVSSAVNGMFTQASLSVSFQNWTAYSQAIPLAAPTAAWEA